MLFGWVVGSVSLKAVYAIARVQNGEAVDTAFAIYRQQMVHRRFIMATLFAVSAYFFTEFALRPVKRAADLQKRFIAIVSHELRTPLTIMKNTSEIALRNSESLDHEKALRIIESNLEETNKLSQTVQFLLTFSLLRTQKRIPEMQTVNLSEVVSKIMPVLEKESEEREVKFSFSSSVPGNVLGSPIALEGLVLNLARNAIAHTLSDGQVSLAISQNKSHTRLQVTDTGSGIAKKDLPYIFEPFYRGKNEDRNEDTYKGFGLGLSIVKEIAEFHRATITVDSRENIGTTFIVTFPK